ncbi:MAG TPA: hypothetical protein VEA63_13030 [Opitutus sp.]|nr:hypothetical protein [Opitutus sp.]
MNPTLRGLVAWIGMRAAGLATVGLGARGVNAAAEERPPIFAAKKLEVVETDAGDKRVPLLSATAKRRIAEQVLADVRASAEAKAGEVAVEKAATELGAEGDVVVLERYVVRELRGPELVAPKNRALEMIRTGRLHTSDSGKTSIDLLGSSVWNSSVGDTGDAKLTLKFTFRW